MSATRSYRDVLARKEVKRADGSGPVWPLRPSETGLLSNARRLGEGVRR